MIRAEFSLRPVGRILGFDLESRPSAFWGSWGPTAEITAFAWKWTDEPDVHTMLLQANGRFIRGDGKRVSGDRAYQDFVAVLAEAGVVFGHNIRKFDLPMLNSGLMRRSLPVLPALRTTDTLRDFPKKKDMSASLENIAVMLGLDDEGGKKHMSIMDWERANKLMPDGMSLAYERVVSDVLLQERVRARLITLGWLKPVREWRP